MNRRKSILLALGATTAFLLVITSQVTAGGPGGGGHGGGGGGYGGGGYRGGDFHGDGYRGYGYRGYGYGYGWGGYGFYDFGVDYPPPVYLVNPPQVIVNVPPPLFPTPPNPALAAQLENRAQIRVLVPADATLSFDGSPTNQTGPEREFITPSLAPGKDFVYTLKARWMQAGQPVERTIRIAVRANETTTADFHALPAPRG